MARPAAVNLSAGVPRVWFL